MIEQITQEQADYLNRHIPLQCGRWVEGGSVDFYTWDRARENHIAELEEQVNALMKNHVATHQPRLSKSDLIHSGLSVATINALWRGGIRSMDELKKRVADDPDGVQSIKHVGPRRFDEIIQVLEGDQ